MLKIILIILAVILVPAFCIWILFILDEKEQSYDYYNETEG